MSWDDMYLPLEKTRWLPPCIHTRARALAKLWIFIFTGSFARACAHPLCRGVKLTDTFGKPDPTSPQFNGWWARNSAEELLENELEVRGGVLFTKQSNF